MEKIAASLPLLAVSAPNSQPSPSRTCSAEYATKRAGLLFGCYRRDEAADPDTFVAAVTMVLTHYEPMVVEAVTDPFSGIASRKNEKGYSGLPDIAEIKEACEAECARRVRMAVYAAQGVTQRRRDAKPAELKATIFTPQGYPKYDAYVKRYETDPSVCYFENRECIDKVVRYGIWTPYGWVSAK